MGGTGSSKVEEDFRKIGEELPEKYVGLENVNFNQKSNLCYANSVI